MTTVEPFGTRMLVVALRVLMGNANPPEKSIRSPANERSASTFIETRPSGVMWGLTLSLMNASWKETTVLPELSIVVKGTWVPCLISASSLSCVATLGDDKVLILPSRSAADS